MNISIEKIIELVTREVISELIKRGYNINQSSMVVEEKLNKKTSVEVDLSGYRTPVLTENHFQTIDLKVNEIIIPTGTIITPGARNFIKKRKITIVYKS